MKNPVVEVINPTGTGRVVLLCEHASNTIPEKFNGLGLSPKDSLSHAAWDPGARALSLLLSVALDAPVVASTVSRLVYDCNRPPEAASAMPEKIERISVPGNAGLTPMDRAARTAEIYDPFCTAVSQVLDGRDKNTIVLTIHSFTPVFHGQARSVELGILHDEDSRLVDAMLSHADRLPRRQIKRNEPYGPGDGVTHSLRLHAQSRGLESAMIEVRNDLLRDDDQKAAISKDLLALLQPALKGIAFEEHES